MRQLFGTDGIRGVAGEYPLDQRTVFAIGRALGARLLRRYGAGQAKVLIGQDTRESSAWIAEALAGGLRSGRSRIRERRRHDHSRRRLPDARRGKFSAGIVISASHNPWMDNGIKLFGRDGMKLADAIEHEIEQEIFTHLDDLTGDFDSGSSAHTDIRDRGSARKLCAMARHQRRFRQAARLSRAD